MRVLIAPDSFTGTLSAQAAAAAVAGGWREAAPDDQTVEVPLSDGGPGFVEVLHAALGGRLVHVRVSDPLRRPVDATYLLADDDRAASTAYVESAAACGLHLVAAKERDPVAATTYGVGQLVAHAVGAGAKRVVVGLGGSSTTDGGEGCVAALGGPPAAQELLAGVDLVAASDVDNPLLGPQGASAVFAPQKGASPAQVVELESRLSDWAGRLAGEFGRDLRAEPGAGAAGGLGAALLALGAHRVSGIGLVLDAVGLAARAEASDLVVTGEGSFDFQSLRGKVVTGVAEAAGRAGVPCIVLAGRVEVGGRELAAAGFAAAYDVVSVAGSPEAALERPAEMLGRLATTVASQWSVRR